MVNSHTLRNLRRIKILQLKDVEEKCVIPGPTSTTSWAWDKGRTKKHVIRNHVVEQSWVTNTVLADRKQSFGGIDMNAQNTSLHEMKFGFQGSKKNLALLGRLDP